MPVVPVSGKIRKGKQVEKQMEFPSFFFASRWLRGVCVIQLDSSPATGAPRVNQIARVVSKKQDYLEIKAVAEYCRKIRGFSRNE